MASESGLRDFEELRCVDHYENKIESPDKEVISPTKEVIRPFIESSQDVDSSVEKSVDQTVREHDIEKVSHDSNGENDLDSGLDSSDNESENEKFIDRQEDIVYAEKPEVLKPPTDTFDPSKSTSKIVDELFNFINEETDAGDLDEQNGTVEELKVIDDISDRSSPGDVEWSLDAVNNNSEQVVESSAHELKNESKTETEFVLTAKTESPRIVEDNVHLVPDTPGDSSMNLYWYSTNLELDPNEVQEFKNSQKNPEESESKRSSTGDDYYRERMEDAKLATEQMPQTEDKNTNLEADSISSERWSPIFESASSRCLDLASEMKAQPEDSKLIENKDITEDENLEHPWGLEIENKLLLESESKQEDLPGVETKLHPVADLSPSDKLDEKPGESSDLKVSFLVRKNVNLKQFDSDFESGIPSYTNEMTVQIKNEQADNGPAVDQADAIGYMELADRDVIKAHNTSVDKTDMSLDSSNVYKQPKEESPTKDLITENADFVVMETEKTEKSEIPKDNSPVDQPDATGFMEIVDKEIIKVQVDNSLYAQLSEKDVKNVDNLKRKSEVKIVTEQFEKDDVEILQSENKEVNVNEIPGQDTVKEKADSVAIESCILTDAKSLETKDTGHEDVVDAASQEIQVESSQKLEPEIHKKEDLIAVRTETVEATVIKHEPVEVVRKFTINDDSDSRVVSKGGKMLRTEIFVDQYFDDSCYKLTLNDSWFRKRNEKFELKTSCSAVLSGGRVLADEKMIILSLQKILSQKSKVGFKKTLSELVTDLGLVEFATFQTTRNVYQLGDYTLALDLTDFGFQSGDIMITVDNPAKVPDAIQRIDKIAKELGFHLLQGH